MTKHNNADWKMHSLACGLTVAFFCLISSLPAWAHVGSPDVFLEANAGPYRLFVTVRVPQVIPGIAQIEIRSESNDIREVRVAPMQLTGPGSQYAPTPDVAQRSLTDPQFFTGSLWLMEFGSLKVRIEVDGAQGKGELAVPVPAIAQRTLPMQRSLGILLFALMLLLGLALVSIASAAVREGDLLSGARPTTERLHRATIAAMVAAVVVTCVLAIGASWWKSDAMRFAGRVYSPPVLEASLESNGRLLLREQSLHISAGNPRRPADAANFDNLIADHEHLMHLFMIRTPEMDSFWHLHPTQAGHATFLDLLPPIPAGHYKLFADVVLSSGFPVTMIGELDVPQLSGNPLVGDDSGIIATPLAREAQDTSTYTFSDGSRMIWARDPAPFKANAPFSFRFHVEDKQGKPARDLEPYMGMATHAEIIRSDSSVFAHVHPNGSVSMAALGLAQIEAPGTSGQQNLRGMDMRNMPGMGTLQPISPELSFPYGFPKPGLYRLFVQIKRSGHIETAVFSAIVQ